jgi:hypothetical protein
MSDYLLQRRAPDWAAMECHTLVAPSEKTSVRVEGTQEDGAKEGTDGRAEGATGTPGTRPISARQGNDAA